ncbi:MAG: serine hydrolase domain-containing protein [Deltaproteobacteria bacterium]|jgi:CubicO group peptidase (beta-lactamase class C family)
MKLTKTQLFTALVGVASLCASNADAAHSQRYVSAGTTWNLGQAYSSALVGYPSASDQGAIVGMGIAGSNDHVYVWYADGHVSSGTTQNFQYHSGLTDYVLPEGKDYWDIVAMAIAGSNDHVFTWYADGTVSEGWSQDLGAYQDPQPFTLPPGRVVSDIVGIGIAGSNDRVYAFYSDGTVSAGWSRDLDYYSAPYTYSVPSGKKIGHIIDIGIAGSNDRVYAWYHDVELGAAFSSIADEIDAAAMDVLRRYRLPGLGVSVSKNGRVVAEKGYGFGNFTNGTRMQDDMRCRIGSVSKVITALSAMHLHQTTSFDVGMPLYGFGGALPNWIYTSAYTQGVERHQPIVAKAIAPSDHVYTWNHDGTVSEGTSYDPDYYGTPYNYSLPPGMKVEDIRGIAIRPNSRVVAYYDDGTYSIGTTWNLDQYTERDEDVKVSLPSGYSMSHVVGMDFAPSGSLYVWYDDGRRSAGTATDFDADIAPQTYSTTPGKTPYFISGMGIAKSNSRVYAFYSDGTFTRGTSRNLDYYAGPANYTIPGYAFDGSKDWNAYYQDMKVDHLMSHSSGFSRSGDVVGAERMFNTSEDNLDYQHVHEYVLRTRKLKFAPGSSESYSNHGAGLVGHIVAERSGMTFRNYALNYIINPLGLNIREHSQGQQSIDMHRHNYVNELPEAYVGDSTNNLGLAAGGWKASAGDLVRLMLGTDQKTNHPDVLSGATLDLMEDRPYPGKSSFAHGWDRAGKKLAHNGRLGGGTTYVAKFEEDYFGTGSKQINVAVCTNVSISDRRGGSGPLKALADAVAGAVNEAAISGSYDLY